MHASSKAKSTTLAHLHVRVKSARSVRARLVGPGVDIRASIGRSGLTAMKREGDGASPRGSFRIVGGYYRPDRFLSRPASGLPLVPLKPSDGWCDAAGHPCYNRPVRRPFSASHEAMWRDDGLYDVVLVLDFNLSPRRQGRGSAIFFHLMRGDRGPTAGCVAIERQAMLRLLPRLSTRTTIRFG